MLTDLNTVRKLAAFVVIVTVAIAMSMGEVINRDGILYLSAAQAFLDGGLDAAIEVYRWPFYSILIGSVSFGTGVSLEVAAHLVNAALMLILVDGFIRLSHTMDDQSPPWIAALLILSFSPFEHRLEIYRDWGYLAFMLCAVVSLVRYWKASQGHISDAVVWQVSIVIALLFRVEAIVLMLLAPLILLFQNGTWRQRVQRYLSVNVLLWFVVVIGLGLIFFGVLPAGKLADLSAYLNPSKVMANFNQTADLISDHALNKYTDGYAQLILISGIVAMIGWMVLDNLGWFFILITLLGLITFRWPKNDNYRVVYWLLFLVFITLFIFMCVKLMAISRFALFASLLVLLFTVHYVSLFFVNRDRGGALQKNWWRFILIGLLLGNLVSIGARPDYKGYIREGGVWIHESLEQGVPLITNDSIIDYYARRPPGEKLDSFEKIEKALRNTMPPYFVALKVDDDEQTEILRLLDEPPIAEFRSNRAAESLLVFEVKRPAIPSGDEPNKPGEVRD
jgi:hypothetical protein